MVTGHLLRSNTLGGFRKLLLFCSLHHLLPSGSLLHDGSSSNSKSKKKFRPKVPLETTSRQKCNRAVFLVLSLSYVMLSQKQKESQGK